MCVTNELWQVYPHYSSLKTTSNQLRQDGMYSLNTDIHVRTKAQLMTQCTYSFCQVEQWGNFMWGRDGSSKSATTSTNTISLFTDQSNFKARMYCLHVVYYRMHLDTFGPLPNLLWFSCDEPVFIAESAQCVGLMCNFWIITVNRLHVFPWKFLSLYKQNRKHICFIFFNQLYYACSQGNGQFLIY